MEKVKHNDDLNARVVGTIDRAVSELMAMGMTHREALHLLATQATVRFDIDDGADMDALRDLKEQISHTLFVVDHDQTG